MLEAKNSLVNVVLDKSYESVTSIRTKSVEKRY